MIGAISNPGSGSFFETSLRGTTNNLAAAVGTAVAGAIVVGLLSASIMRNVVGSPVIPPELKAQVNLDNTNFISDDQLLEVMRRTTATPEQIDEAMRINTEARLLALKMGLLPYSSGFALLALFPAGRLPNYKPRESPARLPERS